MAFTLIEWVDLSFSGWACDPIWANKRQAQGIADTDEEERLPLLLA